MLYRRIHGKWEPFAEGMVGGGLNRRINPRWAVRLFDVDYFPTTFNNNANDHQNSFKVTAGVVLHF